MAIARRRLRFAMVCASNMNRSMEAHNILKKHNFIVRSYGVGGHVRLPGPSAREPNVYDFGTPYQKIYDDLKGKDEALYIRIGLLKMVERNVGVKAAPERWQLNTREQFDVVVCFEERVMDQVVEDMYNRTEVTMRPVCVINIDVKDNHEEAAKVAPQTLHLCQMLEDAEPWEDSIDSVLTEFEKHYNRRPMYTICYY